jgi:hypothetical protein
MPKSLSNVTHRLQKARSMRRKISSPFHKPQKLNNLSRGENLYGLLRDASRTGPSVSFINSGRAERFRPPAPPGFLILDRQSAALHHLSVRLTGVSIGCYSSLLRPPTSFSF